MNMPFSSPARSRRLRGAGLLAAAALAWLAGCTLPPTRPVGTRVPDTRPARPEPATPAISLRLIGETRLPHGFGFQGTTVGGLSGLDYDPESGTWYLLSDDRSEHGAARFYTAKLALSANGLERVDLVSAIPIRRPDGSPYPKAPAIDLPDPESIRFDPLTKTLLWTSEGERRPPRLVQPAVRKMGLDGKYLDRLTLPAMFTVVSDKQGPRNNLSFEGLALSPSHKHIWLANEDALFEDGPVSSLKRGGLARITQFDRTARKAVAQYVYALDPIPHAPVPANDYADNGIAEILALSENSLLVLERSYAEGRGNSIRLFEAHFEDAANVLEAPSLRDGGFQPMKKRLVLDFAAVGLKKVDNLEGMAWGPKLPNGRRTLVFVSDDNFNPNQTTQFLAFEVME